ncbi:MAG TPA: hypothetical protein VEK15_08920 [Vicinamibacteria bacterium]|nr:hypothetical protein [Vicinamibacteria bacterium]
MDEPVEPVSLRFDKADLGKSGGEAPTCEFCLNDIQGSYYDVNGQTACESCLRQVESARSQGTPVGRAFRALFWGGLGGLVGAGIYYAVLALSGYEVGLVAIIVGVLVGFGVRKGSNGVGGRRYQVLAVAIAYLSIVSTYIPFIVEEIMKQGEAMEEPAAGEAAPAVPTIEGASEGASEEEPAAVDPPLDAPPLVLFVIGVVLIVALAAASPFLAGIENVIGLLIIGFALYEAWRVNAYAPLQVEGPFEIGTPRIRPDAP